MRVWDQYPQFFRRVPAAVRDGAAPALLPRVREEIGHTPHRSTDSSNDGHDDRRSLLALPIGVRRQLGITSREPTARLTGARAKQSGREFEAEIEISSAIYERRSQAVLYRHHAAVEGWGRTLRVIGRGPADFSGVVRLASGASVAVAFDCKVVTGSASYRHAPRDRHQLESLLRFRSAGGIAFLLLLCRVLDRVWRLDDLDALLRGERVEIRRRTGSGFEHLLPVLAPSTTAEMARHGTPHWDLLGLIKAEA